MPGNGVLINSAKELEWYVGDSKMDALIAYLDEIGYRNKRYSRAKKVISSGVSS